MAFDMDDLQLVRAYHDGDEESFKELFRRHKNCVFNFAFRLIGNRADAEDVTSEVFMQLMNKRFMPTGEAKLTTWMYAVARNGCLTRIRTIGRQVSFWRRKDNGEEAAWEPEDPQISIAENLKQREMSAAVARAIALLPYEQREAIVLREYHDMNYAQIAEILDYSLEKVKILIFRGRESLRGTLARFLREA